MKNLFIILVSLLAFFSCQKKEVKDESRIESTPSMVSAYTHGIISRESVIRVQFIQEIADSSQLNNPLEKNPFNFTPEIKGSAVWSDLRTLEFRPEGRLKDGENYKAVIDLAQFSSEDDKNKFEFKFTAIKQALQISIDGLRTPNPKKMTYQQLTGTLQTSDVEHAIEIEKVLSAKQGNRKLKIIWDHNEDRIINRFTIDSISRGENASFVKLSWNGKAINVNDKGENTIAVPSLGSFKVTGVSGITKDQQYIEIRFSDPLKKNQNINGLIHADKIKKPTFTIKGNVVQLFSRNNMVGTIKVTVEPGIKNSIGKSLQDKSIHHVDFPVVKPKVRFVGKGVIIPTTKGTTIPVETMNLNSVVVEATQIFENNVPQFLQVNSLSSNTQLKRVGRVVWKKRINLNLTSGQRNRWVSHGLDVASLIKNEPGGIYSLKLSFTRGDIAFHCENENQVEEVKLEDDESWDTEDAEDSNWDYWYDGDFNWSEYHTNKDNPCHPAYYMPRFGKNIGVSRNILISDIGLIAKRNDTKGLWITAADIQSTKPITGAKITVLDYQQQSLGNQTTDSRGFTEFKVERKPFLVIAENNNQYGYLKLDKGSALSISHFDVGGETVKKGLKGFIYGERGIWRPGDTLFLTFILNDKENPIPAGHPIKLELNNSRGQLVKTIVKTKKENSFYCYALPTEDDAPTGNWNVKVSVGSVDFTKKLKVETVKPNRLKIGLDFNNKSEYLEEGTVNGKLSSKWLHGATAENLKAEISINFSERKTSFNKYSDYLFDDPVREFDTEEYEVASIRLDENGERDIEIELHANKLSPGMLNTNFTTKVYEPGGDFSIDRVSFPFHPYNQYIGIRTPKGDKARGMFLTDTTHTVNIVSLKPDGSLVKSGRVQVSIQKISWRWWWDKSNESLADYVGTESYKTIKCDTIDILEGRGSWDFKIKYPSWGRYLIRAKDLDGDHITGKVVYIDWPGWAGRAQKDNPGGATVLSIASDKQEYNVNENIKLTIPGSKKGRALVSIESGNRVIKADWVELNGEVSTYEFSATEEMTPNIYAHVTLLQPHLQVENDLPIRLYGVAPIKIVDPDTKIKPVITCSDEFKPGEKTEITVSELDGKKMTYTLAVVDEGLLDLTRFKTPDPWDHFYKKVSLGIQTWDLYDEIAGAYGGELEQMLAIGGGGEVDQAKKKANRFPPVVKFIGPFELDKKKKNKHTIEMPQYVGAVRVMVVGGNSKSYGNSDKSVFVRKPLMILGTLPRVLRPNEEVELPVSVFALNENVKMVSVEIKTEGPIELIGEKRKSLTFSKIGDQLVNLKLKASSDPGVAKVTIIAKSGSFNATQEIEIDNLLPGGLVVDVIDTTLTAGKKWDGVIKLPGIVGTNSALIEVSRIPPLNLGKRLKYLIRYPHGCVEQTTSSVFPQLYLDKFLKLSPANSKERDKNIKAGINRLNMFQISDGGFAYWPQAPTGNEWASSYAGHFLLEARSIGYHVSDAVIGQWKQYQKKMALSYVTGGGRSELTQAYRLYTLALAGASELGAMNRLRENKDLSIAAKYRLASTYMLAGQQEIAESLIKGGYAGIKKYRELSNTFGSDLRDKAMILETLCLLGKNKQTEKLVDEISEKLCSSKWMSTQTSAYALVAMARFAGLDKENSSGLSFSVKWNNKNETMSFTYPVIQKELFLDAESEVPFTIVNTSGHTLYPRLILEGIPEMGEEKASSSNMSMIVRYVNMNGSPIDPATLNQGTNFKAIVKVTNTGNSGRYDEIALSHVVPSGWEIHNKRLDYGSIINNKIDYQDIRDDRVYTYFSLNQGETKRIELQLNSSYLGKFYLPMIYVETMYDATINARIPGKWITVSASE